MATQTAIPNRSFREVFLAGWRLLSPAERRRGAWLSAAQVVQSALDALAVSAVLPLVGVLVQPDVTQTNAQVRRLYELLGSPPYARLVTLLAAFALTLVAARAFVSMLVEYVSQRYVAACQSRLARDLLTECVNAPYPWFLTRNASLIAKLFYNDVALWSRGFVQRLMSITSDAIAAAFATALLLVLTPVLGLIVITGVSAVAVALMTIVRPRLALLAERKRVALDRALLASSQAIAGIKDVKLSSNESHFVRLFDQAHRVVSVTHARLNIWQQIVPLALPVVGLAGVIGIVLLQVQMGKSRGEIAAQTALLLLVSSRIVPSVSQLSSSISALWNSGPYVDALHELRASIAAEVAGRPRRRVEPWDGEWKELALVRVGYAYPKAEASALREVTLSIQAGAAYGLAGPSGAGKSTFVDLLLRLLDPTEGELRIDGRLMDAVDLRAWQSRIGYVPQSPYIADDTLRANVAFGVPRERVDDAWVRECLRLAHLQDVLTGLEDGLDTSMGDRGLRMSGGQRQRIAVARALYGRPRLLVLDEATSALDRISEGAIQEAIDGLRGQVTTVTIAHRLATIEHCDTIFVFDEGRLAAQGTYDELLRQSALFRRMASERKESEAELVRLGPEIMNVPIARPELGEEEVQAITRVVRSGWIMQGPEVAAFEQEFAAAVGAAHAVAVSNGTVALELALRVMGVGPGDEVATVSHSFIATVNAVSAVGARPVLVDIEPDTLGMSARDLEAALSPRTKAVLCVHQLGLPCDIEAILAVARARSLAVIEDAACAIGSELWHEGRWQRLGRPFGDIAGFSFHPRKVVTTGEGGMLTTSDESIARRLRLLRQHAMSLPDAARPAGPGPVFEEYLEPAFNYRMTDLQAALGRPQIARLDRIVADRARLASDYALALADHPILTAPSVRSGVRWNWQSYPARLREGCGVGQTDVMRFLLDRGIACRRGVSNAHQEPAYADRSRWRCGPNGLHTSERMRDSVVMLPLYHGMKSEEQAAVRSALDALRDLDRRPSGG